MVPTIPRPLRRGLPAAETAAEPNNEPAGEPAPTATEEDSDGLPDGWTLVEADGKGIQTWVLAEDAVVVATYYAAEPDPELWRSMLDTMEPGRGS